LALAGVDFPGLADTIAGLALVAPGFFVIYLISVSKGRRLSDNAPQLVLSSTLISAVLDLVFLGFHGLRDSDSIVLYILDHPRRTALEFLLLSATAAFGLALLDEFNPLASLVRAIIRKARGQESFAEPVWEKHLHDHLSEPVLVEGKDGRLIAGFLRFASDQGEENSVVLEKPALTTRAADGKLSGVELGESILLLKDDIRTITVLEPEADDPNPTPAVAR